MVQPAPQPFSVAATASVSGWSGSGVNPGSNTSGVVSSYPGPHYVEEQSLTINYVRVPGGYGENAGLDLDSASATYTHLETKLAVIVTANYSRKKVDAIFDTPSYQQPQKFEFLGVSSDYLGQSYGNLNASTLGPAGEIVTTQPWYYRRPWVDTSDTEVVSSVTCANFAIGASSFGTLYSEDQDSPQARRYEKFFISPGAKFTFLESYGMAVQGSVYPSYRLPGAYNTSQESLVDIINFIEQISAELTAENLYAIPPTIYTNYFGRDTGLPFYQSFRHDYS